MLIGMANRPHGFTHEPIGDGIVIRHHGRPATTLRGTAATRFLADLESGDPQELMARVTGNYKRGNERAAGQHPRNANR